MGFLHFLCCLSCILRRHNNPDAAAKQARRASDPPQAEFKHLSVGLGDTLELVLLLDGVAVGASLGGVDELISQALGDGLDVPEGGLSGSGAEQPDGLVDATEGRHVHSLATDGSGAADTGGVLAGARVDDGVDEHLKGVLKAQKGTN